ncbi:hypothetical protein MNBD_GAMMA16-1088 [hydrothermal vent metagenome]|uniref:DUF3341 domain-containing protein n=1 Tax=hydrothermal vent metagenome TaxID=652676 RepID=A0A3B0ZIB0_9ZZZZ
MKKYKIMGLFANFGEAFNVIKDVGEGKLQGASVDDITTKSPIEHPDIDEVLGPRKSHVPKFTLCGAVFGITFGFLFLAAAQANFLVQPQGGKAIIPIPSNIVLTYEMMILFAVLSTVAGFLITARMFTKRSPIYSEKVGVDQIGIIIDVDDSNLDAAKALLKSHQVLEIREEVLK